MFVAQASSTRTVSDSLKSDLHTVSGTTQHSMSANIHSSHPTPALHLSAPETSTAGQHWSGYSAARNPPVFGYSWMTQALSGLQPARQSVMEGMSHLCVSTESTVELQDLTRHAGLPTQDESQLTIGPHADSACLLYTSDAADE